MDHKDDGTGLEADRDQALWKLLGRAPSVEVSPYFARRVLRDLDAGVCVADEAAAGWRAWLRPRWFLAGGAAACAVVLGLFSISSLPVAQPRAVVSRHSVSPVPVVVDQHPAPPAPAIPAVAAVAAVAAGNGAAAVEVADDVSPQDVDVIADLDNLVAREETNVWTGDDTSRF